MGSTKINSNLDLLTMRGSETNRASGLTTPLFQPNKPKNTELPAPFSAAEKRGFDSSALLKFRLQNAVQTNQTAQTGNADRVFKTTGGEWRGKNAGEPEFYQTGADVSGTTLFDKQFYQNADGKWIELNAGGRLCDLPANKNQPRPANVPEFDWQGWREVSPTEIPADYSAAGKTVAFADTRLAADQKCAFKRYLVDQNLTGDWDEVLGERLIDGAMQKGAKIETVSTGTTDANGKTVFEVKLDEKSLAILRGEIKDYKQALERGGKAQTAGTQEANKDVADMGGAIYETARKAAENIINSVPDALNTVFQTDPSCKDKSIPSFGRVKLGTPFDKACGQTKNTPSDLFPTLDTSAVKYDFRSEWMRRDINGRVDGKGIKQGEATTSTAGVIAPFVIGKVISPVESPKSLKDLGGLPVVETTTATVENAAQTVAKAGRLEVEKGRTLSTSERAFADKMVGEGKVVKAPKEVNIEGVKNPDFNIDGEVVEFKYVSDLKGTNADKLSGGLSRRILDGKSQASKVTINVENQPGMTEEIAKRAVDRAYGALKTQNNVNFKEVRIFGKDFDFTIPFRK